MKNLEKIIKIMESLSDVDQEILVGFKLSCSENVHYGRDLSARRFKELSSQEKMRVLHLLEADEISSAYLCNLTDEAKYVLAEKLILKDSEE